MSSVPTRLAAELLVVMAIFIGAAVFVNGGAILSAIQAWGSW